VYDLLVKGGTVIDPSQGLESVGDIAINHGKVVAFGTAIPVTTAREVIDATGLLVTPGLIDIHVHIYEGVTHLGVNADVNCLNKGVTSVIDAGSSGAQTFPGLRKYIIGVSRTRILAYLNLSDLGMVTENAGELEDLRYADTKAALRMIEANRDIILGVKVRMDRRYLGENGTEVLKLARATAEAAALPIMFHIGETSPPLPRILAEAQADDVITHCFTSRPGGILDEERRILPDVLKAVQRGVLFDVGHGVGSFSFRVARQAMAQGFTPATISSDLHALNVAGPVFDLVTTMSKFLYLGVSLSKVIEMTTLKPARLIRMEKDLGTLRAGAYADLTLLKLLDGPCSLSDAGRGVPVETVVADQILAAAGAVRDGQLIFFHPASRSTV